LDFLLRQDPEEHLGRGTPIVPGHRLTVVHDRVNETDVIDGGPVDQVGRRLQDSLTANGDGRVKGLILPSMILHFPVRAPRIDTPMR